MASHGVVGPVVGDLASSSDVAQVGSQLGFSVPFQRRRVSRIRRSIFPETVLTPHLLSDIRFRASCDCLGCNGPRFWRRTVRGVTCRVTLPNLLSRLGARYDYFGVVLVLGMLFGCGRWIFWCLLSKRGVAFLNCFIPGSKGMSNYQFCRETLSDRILRRSSNK